MATLPQVLSGYAPGGTANPAVVNPTMAPFGGFTGIPGVAATTPQQLADAINANYAKQGVSTRVTTAQAAAMIQANPAAYNQPPAAPTAANLGYQAPPQPPITPNPGGTPGISPQSAARAAATGGAPAATPTTIGATPFGQDPMAAKVLQAVQESQAASPTSPVPNAAPTLFGQDPMAAKTLQAVQAVQASTSGQPGGTAVPPPPPASGGGGAGVGGGGTSATGYGAPPTGYVPNPPTGAYPSVPGGYTSPAISPPGTGGDSNLAQSLESDRELALAQGQQLQTQFGSQNAAEAARAAALQEQLAQAYGPLLAGQGGYTQEQIAAIEAKNGQFGLDTLNPNAPNAAFETGAAGVNAALGGETGAVDRSLATGAANVNATINPADLTYTPEMQQELVDQAARANAAQTQSTVQDIQNRAFAAGNTSPAAIAAMEDRARQTGQINAADAMANARLAAQQQALAASQTRTNIESQNAQENAQRDVGAQLNLGATNVGAQTFLTGAGVGTAEAGQTEGMNLNNLESGRATTVANTKVQAGQEARNNYLGTQEQQASQNVNTTGQQQINTFGTENSGVNQGAQGQIANKSVNQQNPGTVTNILGFRKGAAAIDGPVLAEVAEAGSPEAIVNLGPPRPMAAGGIAAPRIMAPPKPVATKLFHAPRFAVNRPTYGMPTGSSLKTITRGGFQRTIPQFADGGVVDDSGLNDTDTPGIWDTPPASGWQKTAAIASELALGRKYPALAAMLAREAMGQGGSGKDFAGAAASDVIGRRNPAAGAAASEAINGTPANPAATTQANNFNNTVLPAIFNYKPPTYAPDSMIVSPAQKSTPRIDLGATAPPAQKTPAPTTPKTPPIVPKPVGISWEPPPTTTPTRPPITTQPVPPPEGTSNSTFHPFPPISERGPIEPVPSPVPGTLPGDTSGSDTSQQTIPGQDTGDTSQVTSTVNGTQYPSTNSTYDPTTGTWTPNPDSPAPPDVTTPPPTDLYPGGDYINGGYNDYGPVSGSQTTVGGGATVPPWGYTGDPSLGGFGGGGNGDMGSAPSIPDGYAKGGVFAPPRRVPYSPYGAEIVTKPSLRVLGAKQPQAVVPLNSKAGNRVKAEQIPALIQKYSRQRPQYGA